MPRHDHRRAAPQGTVLTLWLAGDVMTGRGIDQALAHPVSPRLHEPWVQDARDYLRLAESASGPIPRPLPPAWPWGQALEESRRAEASLGLVNLETAITARGRPWPGKGIHYRMHPANIDCLLAAGPIGCTLANNHVLDWHQPGLADTLTTLAAHGIPHAGAGHSADQARRPLCLEGLLPAPGRLWLWSLGLEDSGIPPDWAATADRPGIYLHDSNRDTAALTDAIRDARRPGDLVVVSVHWGGNWGYRVAEDHRRLAHRLIEAGADLIHGHSSHHPRGLECHRGAPILYGCGDLINDYEGIAGHERYRPDLALLYVCRWRGDKKKRQSLSWDGLTITPLRRQRFRLVRASREDAAWLVETLNRVSRPPLTLGPDGRLRWGWEEAG